MPHQNVLENCVRKRDLPKFLGISRSTLANWLNPRSRYYKADFPAQIRLSSRLTVFRRIDVEAWIEKMTESHKLTKGNIQGVRTRYITITKKRNNISTDKNEVFI